MPKEIKEAKEFLELFQEPTKKDTKKPAQEGEAKKAVNRPKNVYKKKLTVKQGKRITKFKLRTSRRLYTFKTDNQETVKKIQNNLPSHIQLIDTQKKKAAKKK